VTLVCFLFWQQLMELDNQYVSELKNMQGRPEPQRGRRQEEEEH